MAPLPEPDLNESPIQAHQWLAVLAAFFPTE
jgi:hypothetical protein